MSQAGIGMMKDEESEDKHNRGNQKRYPRNPGAARLHIIVILQSVLSIKLGVGKEEAYEDFTVRNRQ